MTLTKNFLQKEPVFIKISRFKIITGILLGLIFSFIFYSFLYLIREVFRVLSVTETYDIWILTDQEVDFYNLIFAFISVIFAQSATFTYWLDRPKNLFGRQNNRKISIINDQRVLNLYFLSWISKLSLVFWLLFGLTFQGGFFVFSFYPDYNYIFILVVIVLFFQTWNTIRLTFKRKSVKWMISSMVIVVIVSFGLSKINLIDYQTINQIYNQKNIHNTYKLDLPTTSSFDELYPPYLVENIYVIKPKNTNQNEVIIVVENKEIDLSQLSEKISEWRSNRRAFEIPLMTFQLHIDKSIKMKMVNKLKLELLKSAVSKIAYAVVPENPKYDIRYYRDFSIQANILNWNPYWFSPNIDDNYLNKFQNTIQIKHLDSGKCCINNSPIAASKIKENIKSLIIENSDYIVNYQANDKIDFSDYFKVITALNEVIKELRDDYSKGHYATLFNYLNYEDRSEVQKKFPLRILEFTSDQNKILNRD